MAIPSSRHYNPGWALASSTTSLHCALFFVFSIHCFIFTTFKSVHHYPSISNEVFLFFCLDLTFQVAIVIPVSKLLSSTSVSHPSEAVCWVSEQIIFMVWGCSPTPNPQPGGPGYPFSSGSSPLTYLAWEALPVAYATASIALGLIWPLIPLHYRVGITSGEGDQELPAVM